MNLNGNYKNASSLPQSKAQKSVLLLLGFIVSGSSPLCILLSLLLCCFYFAKNFGCSLCYYLFISQFRQHSTAVTINPEISEA